MPVGSGRWDASGTGPQVYENRSWAVIHRTTGCSGNWARSAVYPRGRGGMTRGTSSVWSGELRQFQAPLQNIQLRPRADPPLQMPPWRRRSTTSCSVARHMRHSAGPDRQRQAVFGTHPPARAVSERDRPRTTHRSSARPRQRPLFLCDCRTLRRCPNPHPHGAAAAGAAA